MSNYSNNGLPNNYIDQLADLSLMTGSPPNLNGFAGLPFRGLDFIRNYNPSGYMTNEQDPLWQSFDPNTFGIDPELPFALGDATTGDLSVDGQDGQQQQQHWSENQ